MTAAAAKFLSIPVSGGADGIATARDHITSGAIDVSNNIFVNTNAGNILRIDTNRGKGLPPILLTRSL